MITRLLNWLLSYPERRRRWKAKVQADRERHDRFCEILQEPRSLDTLMADAEATIAYLKGLGIDILEEPVQVGEYVCFPLPLGPGSDYSLKLYYYDNYSRNIAVEHTGTPEVVVTYSYTWCGLYEIWDYDSLGHMFEEFNRYAGRLLLNESRITQEKGPDTVSFSCEVLEDGVWNKIGSNSGPSNEQFVPPRPDEHYVYRAFPLKTNNKKAN